ncbi:hypothetical protein BU17DRAFT_60301 [Hysterangium stoloniferum]|nr:hypothetical protein BU17DRAFT_71072 [Hysterangium stoloniferum]KAF8530605.1 hypothetical protein BU17DRAFT_60301 [Hysterangium stoloniferum]
MITHFLPQLCCGGSQAFLLSPYYALVVPSLEAGLLLLIVGVVAVILLSWLRRLLSTLAPSPNSQSHPPSIPSSPLPASSAPITAPASSSGLCPLARPTPPSFSRMDLETKDQDRLARDFIIDDDVQSSVQAATGRAPTVDEGDDRGEAIQVGHSDVKNQEAEATKVKQQDIPLPTLPQRYIIGNNTAHSGLFPIFINGIIKILNANIAPTQEDGPEFSDSNHPATPKKPSALGKRPIANILDFMERAVPEQSQLPSDKDLHVMAFAERMPNAVDSSFASTDATLVNIEEMDDQTVGEGSKSVPVGITEHPTTGDDKEKDGILRYTGRTVYRVVALPPIFTWGEGNICQSLMDMSLGLQYSPQIATRPQLHLSLEQISAIKVWRERQPRPYILVLPPLPGDFIFSEESGIKQPEFQFKTITDEFGEVITTRMGSKYLPAVAEKFHAAWRNTDDRITPKQVTSEAGSFIPESPESAIDLMDNCNISLDSARDPSEAMDVLAGNSVAPTTREASLSIVERKQEQQSLDMLPEVDLKPAHTEEKVIVIEDVVPAANVFINCSVNCVGSNLTSEVNLPASKETEEQREVDILQNVVLEQAEGVDMLKNNYAPVPAKEGSMTDSFRLIAFGSLRTLPGAMNEFMDIIGRNVVAQNPPSEPSLSVVEQTEEKQSRGMPPESYDPMLEYTAAVQNMWAMVNISMNRSGDSVGPDLPAGRDTEDQQGAEISPSAVLRPAETEEIPEEGEKAEEQSGVDEPVSEQAAAEPATSDGKKKKKKKKKKKAAVSDGGPAMDIPDNGEPHPLAQAVVAPPPSPPCHLRPSLGVKSKGQMHGMFAKGITAPSEIVHTGCYYYSRPEVHDDSDCSLYNM